MCAGRDRFRGQRACASADAQHVLSNDGVAAVLLQDVSPLLRKVASAMVRCLAQNVVDGRLHTRRTHTEGSVSLLPQKQWDLPFLRNPAR